MCGISGIYATQLINQHQNIINQIIESQYPRGPDHQDSTLIKSTHGQIILGHNRLSIIDLSENANQPMWDMHSNYCIVYNGEIYNYIELRQELKNAGLSFRTESDTEVILNAFSHWGISALQRFRGPFAFALYDTKEEILWLCRDRFGIRPLYYIKMNNVFYFASTTQALAKALNLSPNYSYLARGLNYLVYEDDSQISPYEGITSLAAGCYMRVQFNQNQRIECDITTYYHLAMNVQNLIETLPIHHPKTLLDLLINQFEHAVRIRLRTDVPLAISLSGGLDSSSVASLVSKQHEHTIGFSFSHPDQKKSEGPIVSNCAKFLNIKMEYVWPEPKEMINALHETIAIQDAPFPTLSIVAQYLLYKKVRASGIKVLLGGQGGDEAFMGYRKFLLFWLRHLIKQKRYAASIKHILQLMPSLFAEISSFKAYWHHGHRYLRPKKKSASILRLPESPLLNMNHQTEFLWQRQLKDITQFSLPTLLRYEDRNAMGNSVESRLPYMDHEVIELGLALPESMKLRAGYGKWIVREMMRDKIPDNIRLAYYKRGFDIPLNTLIKNGLGDSIRTKLKMNQALLNDFLHSTNQFESTFSDQQFLKNHHLMSDAITLLWLNKVLA